MTSFMHSFDPLVQQQKIGCDTHFSVDFGTLCDRVRVFILSVGVRQRDRIKNVHMIRGERFFNNLNCLIVYSDFTLSNACSNVMMKRHDN